MEQVVAALGGKIGALRAENESLRLALTKHEILSSQRLESVKDLDEKSRLLSLQVDQLLLERSAITRERDDSLIVVENLFSRISEMKNQIDQVDELRNKLDRAEQVNRDLQELLGKRRFDKLEGFTKMESPEEIKISGITTATQTEQVLALNKYTQTFEETIHFRE